jgi:hypothetical protein
MEQRELIRKAAAENMLKAQARQKKYFDRKRRAIRFPPGSLVRMLLSPDKMAKKRKFEPPWLGPFVVVKEKHPDVYKLRDLHTGMPYRRTVNVERLFPFRERSQPLEEQPPTGREVNQRISRPPATRQRPEPVEEGLDPADEPDEADTEIEPTDGVVAGEGAAETVESREPEIGTPDYGVAEQDIPEPSDQALPEEQPAPPVVSDMRAQAEAEEQTPPESHMEVTQEPARPELRRSDRNRHPPDRLLPRLLEEREKALRPTKPSFGIHVLGTMVHDLIGW